MEKVVYFCDQCKTEIKPSELYNFDFSIETVNGPYFPMRHFNRQLCKDCLSRVLKEAGFKFVDVRKTCDEVEEGISMNLTYEDWRTIYYALMDKRDEYKRSLSDCPEGDEENFQRWIAEIETLMGKIWPVMWAKFERKQKAEAEE